MLRLPHMQLSTSCPKLLVCMKTNLDKASFISCTFQFSYKSDSNRCVGLCFKATHSSWRSRQLSSQFQKDNGSHKLWSPLCTSLLHPSKQTGYTVTCTGHLSFFPNTWRSVIYCDTTSRSQHIHDRIYFLFLFLIMAIAISDVQFRVQAGCC